MNRSKNTAITRNNISRPLRDLLDEYSNLFRGRILDYGSGRGVDASYLRKRGMVVSQYDKFHFDVPPIGDFHLILNTYVLNVIRSKEERAEVIRKIAGLLLPNGYAFITVRTDKEINRLACGEWKEDGDGYETKSGTFQRGFSRAELGWFITTVLNDVEGDFTVTEGKICANYAQIKFTRK